jgi:circadian clock protein KaiC
MKDERITTGMPELEVALGGGLPRDPLTAVVGTPGTGKAILAPPFAFAVGVPGVEAEGAPPTTGP